MFKKLILAAIASTASHALAGTPPDEFVFEDFASFADVADVAEFNDQWARSTAITRGYAFVGSPNSRNPSINSGVLALFRLPSAPGQAWTFERFIDPPVESAPFAFARSVAADGDWMAVTNGARCPDTGNNERGVVHLYERNTGGAGAWGYHATLCMNLPAGIEGGTMDSSIDMHGEFLIVGNASADVDGESDAGAAFVFQRDSGGQDNWGQVAALTRDLPIRQDRAGLSVGIYSDIAIVGAPQAELDGDNDVGVALVFQRNSATNNWDLVRELRGGAMPLAGDEFGKSADIWDDIIVVGSGADDTQGAAHVFYKDLGGSNNWGELIELTAGEFVNTNFGQDVEIRGDELMVGTFAENKVFVFKQNQGGDDQWGQVQLLESPEPGSDRFGETVSFLNGFAVIGDSSYDDLPTTESNIGAATLLFDDVIFRDDFEGLDET